MSLYRNPLFPRILTSYIGIVKNALSGNPADGNALLSAIKAEESVTDRHSPEAERLRQVLKATLNDPSLINGAVTGATIATAGSGYTAGKSYPIGGDGTSGVLRITSVDASGAITGVEITVPGHGYTTATVDLSGDGDGTADITLTVGRDDIALIEQALNELDNPSN